MITGTEPLAVDSAVIAPDELVRRVESLLASVDRTTVPSVPYSPRAVARSHGTPIDVARQRAHTLHQRFGLLHPPEVTGGEGAKGQATRFTKRAVRKLTGWYVEPRWTVQTDFDAATAWTATDVVLALEHLESDLQRLSHMIADVGADQARLRVEMRAVSEAVHERHDAELSSLHYDVADLNGAIGTVAARLENLRRHVASSDVGEQVDVPAMPEPYQPPMVDYSRFEDRFRGSSSELAEEQRGYLPIFGDPAERPRIVDLGCGRGEMLKLLESAGFEAVGIETDGNMLEVCRKENLNVLEADAILWLQSIEPESLDGIFCAQVIEHLPVAAVPSLVAAARRTLKRGAPLVIETIDPRSAFALGNWFYADMTHVRPVYPPTLVFLCEAENFSTVELLPRSRHPAMQLLEDLPDDATGRAIKPLLENVFGYQDYAVVARK
jgi:O-antigen chain-terminating methyltransferase